MAEEKKDAKPAEPVKKDHFSEMVWLFLGILVLLYVVNGFIAIFNSSKLFGSGFKFPTPKNLWLSLTQPISSLLNPVNTKFVVTSDKASLYDTPGGKEIEVKKLGDKGTIVGGPVNLNNEKYWQVKFDDGSSGWISEKDIANLPVKLTPMKDMATLVGGVVETSRTARIFSEPGINQIATQPAGAKAVILEGPLIKDGVKYWHVKFDDGKEGWVAEGDLSFISVEKQPLSSVADPVLGAVSVSKDFTPVFSEPGVNQISTKSKGSVGQVVAGPETVQGIDYWQIKFEDGTVGWVAEDDLDYVKIYKTPLSSMPSLIGGEVRTLNNNVPLYDYPGGKQISSLNKGLSGTIIEGPLVVDGVKYWHVKFDNGEEGWVSENDLLYVQDVEPNFFIRMMFLFWKIATYMKYILIFLSFLLFGWIVHLSRKLTAIRIVERERLYPNGQAINNSNVEVVKNPQWEKILKNIDSLNESDWRLAILEADIMLGDLLERMYLPGDTIGDKLKAVEKSDFTTLDNAWEAHKVRNQVAHEGQSFVLTDRETRRVVDLYRTVFEEFHII